MTNTKTRTTGKVSKDVLPNGNNNNDVAAGVPQIEVLDGALNRNWYGTPDVTVQDTEDDEYDGFSNDGTSTSFSLQECMDEFRARRVRRVSSHSRHEVEKGLSVGNCHDATERDLINQNMCNKEHERKCKPCKDGFCYCFTSDSGEGSAHIRGLSTCGGARGYVRHSRRHRSSECGQTIDGKRHCIKKDTKSAPTNMEFPKVQKASKIGSVKTTGQLTAISRLETSNRDAPLIHIIQELRDNCVISEVRVNKHKLLSGHPIQNSSHAETHTVLKKAIFKDSALLGKSSRQQQKMSHKTPIEPHTPSAPVLENILELNSKHANCLDSSLLWDNTNQSKDKSNRRNKAGGRLLQKRLSKSNFRYTPRDTIEPPPKPPRCSLSFEDKSSVSNSSTSPSVQEAERILDDFLARRGYKASTISNEKASIMSPKHNMYMDKEKRKSYPLATKEEPSYAKQVLATYPSLSDIEHVVHSKKYSHYGRNMRKCEENQSKVFRIGWNEPKIHDMLNYDSKTNDKVFRSTAIQAEPQKSTQSVGWQIPPKIDIDTVDGIVRHNIAANIENKDTPVKSKLYQSSKSGKTSKSQRSMWSEQLRNLSPWSNKNQGQTEYRKSNLRSSPKEFLKSSKKKILRLVSPKKNNKERHNFQIRKTPYRNVAIQTYNEDFGHHPYLQSPPGSYHSPIQSSLPQSSSFTESRNTTTNELESGHTHFDFSRHIHSPTKKTTRSSQRKLNFPLTCAAPSTTKEVNVQSAPFKEMKTYRSFNGELDHDVSLSKMSYILSNIRTKLEASDEHAIRTFRETEHAEPIHIPSVFDDDQSKSGLRSEHGVFYHNDPIYSEIEDDSMRISESPNFENRAGIQHFNVEHNPQVLYALVNKSNKLSMNTARSLDKALLPQYPTPLAKILHDSLKSKRNTQKKNVKKTPSLSPLPEPPGGEVASYSSTSLLDDQLLLHCHSMNNVRVMEHHSPPKRQRNLSKSDLSLHRSEIFLENLCKSELIVESQMDSADQEKLQKIENNKSKQSYVILSQPSSNDTLNTVAESEQDVLNEDVVSYELPGDDIYGINDSIYIDSTNAGSNFGLSAIDPPSLTNQSTPKKPSFTTKDKEGQLNVDITHDDMSQYNGELNNSCPNSPNKSNKIVQLKTQHNSRSHSFNEICDYQTNTKKLKSTNILPTYKHLKIALHKSFQMSKDFVKKEAKRLSTSFIFTESNSDTNMPINIRSHGDSILGSDFDLDSLLSLNQCVSINEQLEQVVNICRQLPDSEISTEMVEAERLLLFSELRRGKQQNTMPSLTNRSLNQLPITSLFIDDMYLPIRADINLDIFFNYFYIVTFECSGIIRSTQSAECQNGLAVFRDCGIEFSLRSELNDEQNHNAVRCNIFMLRLRKVSTLSVEPTEMNFPETRGTSHSSSTSLSSNEIVSRFRLHASFILNCNNFIPYDYVAQESISSDRLCLRASRTCNIMLKYCSRSSNLSNELKLKGRAEVRFPKRTHAGFLNVEDPYTQHNWNRRWCTLDGIHLHVWQDENILNGSPLLSLDLQANPEKLLTPAPRDLCARARSFCLVCTIRKTDEDVSAASVFFAADTQEDLRLWINSLNVVLNFINTWL